MIVRLLLVARNVCVPTRVPAHCSAPKKQVSPNGQSSCAWCQFCTKTIDFEVDRDSHLPSTRSTDLDDDGQSVRLAQYAFASRKVQPDSSAEVTPLLREGFSTANWA